MENVLLFFDLWKWHIILGISIVAFIIQALVTNKLNKTLYGRYSILAFIPFLNMFTLGKVCADEIVGIILMLSMAGVDKTLAIIPESTSTILFPYCMFLIICLFIYSIFKFFRSIKDKKGKI